MPTYMLLKFNMIDANTQIRKYANNTNNTNIFIIFIYYI